MYDRQTDLEKRNAELENQIAGMKQEKQNNETLKLFTRGFAFIGAVAGSIAAFAVAGDTWGWLWLLVFAPIGAAVGCFCGFLFGGGSIRNLMN